MRYQAQYDRQARAWNVVDILTNVIVGMFAGGKSGEQRAKRSADNHNEMWLKDQLAEMDAGTWCDADGNLWPKRAGA